jgi:serine/threonine-protein kinase
LNHPNIVSCFSVRQAEGLHFFVMRYIQGRSLDQIIRDAGRLPIPIVRSIVGQVSSALTYAHRSRVVHRDIKPANILIDVDGNAVVTDFGIAKVARLPGHTHTGALVGTPAYMSPEQCAGTEVTGATDQYSLGSVAYEMITGQAPFTGSTLTVMQSQVEVPPPAIRDRCPDCPPDLEAAVLRMLAKDPADRFPDAGALGEALRASLEEPRAPLASAPAGVAPTMIDPAREGGESLFAAHGLDPRRVGRAVLLLFAALVAVALLLVVVRLATAGQDDPSPARSGQAGDQAREEDTAQEPPATVTVPDVVGEEAGEAGDELAALDLAVAEQFAASEDFDEDLVVSSNPGAGADVKPGSTVTLTISTGDEGGEEDEDGGSPGHAGKPDKHPDKSKGEGESKGEDDD